MPLSPTIRILQSIWLILYVRRRTARVGAELPKGSSGLGTLSGRLRSEDSRYLRSAAAMAVFRSMIVVRMSSIFRNLTMMPSICPSLSMGRMEASSAKPLIS